MPERTQPDPESIPFCLKQSDIDKIATALSTTMKSPDDVKMRCRMAEDDYERFNAVMINGKPQKGALELRRQWCAGGVVDLVPDKTLDSGQWVFELLLQGPLG